MAEKSALDMMFEAFLPIVMKDEDIIKFIKESELDKEGIQNVAVYLTASAAGMYLATVDKERFADEIQKARNAAAQSVKALSERSDQDVNEILFGVLKENIEEWFEIMGEMMKKAHMEDQNDDSATPQSKPETILTAFGKVLVPIVLREDDVTEFIEEFEEDARNDIVSFIVNIVLFNWASYYQDHKDEASADDAIAQRSDELVEILKKAINSYANYFEKHLEDYQEFQARVKEIIDDHLNEFVKKMYKAIAKINASRE